MSAPVLRLRAMGARGRRTGILLVLAAILVLGVTSPVTDHPAADFGDVASGRIDPGPSHPHSQSSLGLVGSGVIRVVPMVWEQHAARRNLGDRLSLRFFAALLGILVATGGSLAFTTRGEAGRRRVLQAQQRSTRRRGPPVLAPRAA